MKSFKSLREDLILEARGAYNDEHAIAHLWNYVSENHHLAHHKDAAKIKEEIEKARKNPNHPLHHSKAPQEGYKGGVVDDEAYYRELHDSAHTIHALANHEALKHLLKKKLKAKVTGSAQGELSETWRRNGAKNKTSKADIKIGEGTKHERGISLKKGDAQLMSAEGEEMKATYDHATDKMMEHDPKFTKKHKEKVMEKIEKTRKLFKDASPKKISEMLKLSNKKLSHEKQQEIIEEHRSKILKEAQEHINSIHREHPHLIHHLAHEASTGEGKFGGKGKAGTADILVTTLKNGAHVHDTRTEGPVAVKTPPRIAKGKGGVFRSNGQISNRGLNLKIDFKHSR